MPSIRKPAPASVLRQSAESVPRHVVPDEATQRALDASAEAVRPVLACALTRGQALTGISLVGTTPKKIAHKLGRVPIGFFITRRDNGADILDTARDDTTITLVSTSTVNAEGWVF